MKVIKKPWFIPIVLAIVVLAVGNYYIKNFFSQAETLSENEIRKQLEDAYGGKVDRLSLEGTMFEAELSRNEDVYLATVDAETGKVLSLIQTKEVIEKKLPIASGEKDDSTQNADTVAEKKNTEQVMQDKVQTSEATTEPEKSGTVLISENQAIKIVLGQLKGEVEDVEFVQTSDGGYYLIKIDDNKDDEATFQIHAISGKILSVTWDD